MFGNKDLSAIKKAKAKQKTEQEANKTQSLQKYSQKVKNLEDSQKLPHNKIHEMNEKI
jgi:hypothetical protein